MEKAIELLNEENKKWIMTLMISNLRDERNPAKFLWILVSALFPVTSEDMTRRETNRDWLRGVRDIMEAYYVPEPGHFSPILGLCDWENKGAKSNRDEGIQYLNETVSNIKVFLRSDEEMRKKLLTDLGTRYAKCEAMAEELKKVAKENKFYRKKVERIQEVIREATASDRDALQVERCIEGLLDQEFA